jgi:dihydroflavonol-4-reductase
VKIFITGADGLLGANLTRQLLARGDAVRALIAPGSRSAALDGLALERLEGDLLDSRFPLAQAINGCEAVFHCAAITDMWASPELTRRVNVEGTRRVLDACLEAGVRRLVMVGSASSFDSGPLARPGDETGGFPALYRGSAYQESKHEAADLTRRYVRERGLDAVIVAPTFLLGPHDSRPSGGELIWKFLLKRLTMVPPGGRCFAYAPDVAGAMIAALDRGRTGETYILGGTNLSYFDFFGKVARIAGAPVPGRILPGFLVLAAGRAASLAGKVSKRKLEFNADIARFSLMDAYYSSEKARRELGLNETPVETAIEDSIRSLREYGHLTLPYTEKFRGKVAVVTGGSRGVGFATARALALRGAKVVIGARGEARLEDSRARLERLGGEVLAVPGDVGYWDDAQKLIGAAIERFGRLDILVNNAGVSMRGRFDELAPAVSAQVVQTNLLGCIYPTQAAIAELKKTKGQVVFISSIGGLFGLPVASIYSATKKALTGLAESLRIELAPLGLHVGVVYLGFTEHDPEKRILAADGSAVLPDRPAHHTQAGAADQIVDLLVKRKSYIVMTPIGKLGAAIYRLSPTLVEKAMIWAMTSSWGIYKRFS